MNPTPIVIEIEDDGTVKSLGNPLGLPGVSVQRRFSEIVPVHPLLRAAFRLIRFLFGDDGLMATWTRQWVCVWEARILSTGETARSENREQLIEWEHSKYYSMKYAPKFDL